MINKNILYLGLLLLAVVSLYLAFSPYSISEAGYSDLLSKSTNLRSISIDTLKIIAVISAALSAILIFLSVKENNFNTLLSVMVFIFSIYVSRNVSYLETPGEFFALPIFALGVYLFSREGAIKYGSVVALFAGLIIVQQYVSFDISKIFSIGLLFPLAFFPLLSYISKMKFSNELITSAFAIASAFFSPPLSAILCTYCFADFVTKFSDTGKHIFFVSLSIFIFYIMLLAGFTNYLNAIIITLAISGFVYLISLLYNSEFSELKSYLMLTLFVMASVYSIINLELYPPQSPSKSDIAAYLQIKEKYQSISVLSDRNSIKYYTGISSFIIQPSALFIPGQSFQSKYLLISKSEVDTYMAGNPKIFNFAGFDKTSGNNQAAFLNLPYYLLIPVSNNGLFNGNAKLVGLTQNGVELLGEIPFTKLKPLFRDIPTFDSNNFIVDTTTLQNTTILKIISDYGIVYNDSSNHIYKVSD